MMINWAAGRAPMPTRLPQPANVSSLTSLPEYFQKLKQQELVNQRAVQAQKMQQEQFKRAQAQQVRDNQFRQKKFDANQNYRNRSLSLEEKRLNAPPKMTSAIREYQFAMGQRKEAGQPIVPFGEWKRMNAKAGATTNNIDLRENKFNDKLGGEMAKYVLGKPREDAMAARSTLQNIAEANKLMKKGIISGFGAKGLLAGAKILNQVGIPGATFEELTANTETYASNMGREVGNVIRAFGSGTGLSDADREYAQKIAAGEISLDAGSIKKLLDIGKRLAIAKVKGYNSLAKKFTDPNMSSEEKLRLTLPGIDKNAGLEPIQPDTAAAPSKAQSILDKYGIK